MWLIRSLSFSSSWKCQSGLARCALKRHGGREEILHRNLELCSLIPLNCSQIPQNYLEINQRLTYVCLYSLVCIWCRVESTVKTGALNPRWLIHLVILLWTSDVLINLDLLPSDFNKATLVGVWQNLSTPEALCFTGSGVFTSPSHCSSSNTAAKLKLRHSPLTWPSGGTWRCLWLIYK